MQFVICAETKCPAWLLGHLHPATRVTAEAAFSHVSPAQFRADLFEVKSQFRQPPGKVVQDFFGHPRLAIAAVSGRARQIYATGNLAPIPKGRFRRQGTVTVTVMGSVSVTVAMAVVVSTTVTGCVTVTDFDTVTGATVPGRVTVTVLVGAAGRSR